VYAFGDFNPKQFRFGDRVKGTPPMEKKSTPEEVSSMTAYDALEDWARIRVQKYIQDLLEEEVTTFLGRRKSVRVLDGDTGGHRNGYGKPRRFAMMSGTVHVRRPRVRNSEERFESRILPLFHRKSKQLGQMLPELYLHGLAQGDFELALRGLLGDGAPLSKASIQRLKAKWQTEYEAWKSENLSETEIVYMWADGLYVKAGIADQKAALLVIVGVRTDGRKALLACESGIRESKESWRAILRDLVSRGLKLPKVAVADGHLGIWSALGELHPEGREQRCWNHKLMNVLDALPKSEQPVARELLRDMHFAQSRTECEKKRDQFAARYKKNQTKAVDTLHRDWDRMITFFDFPKEHWVHLRTTNIVESPFSAIRLRTDAARRHKRVENATGLIWKLLKVAEKRWRTFKGFPLLQDVYDGKPFVDGRLVIKKSDSVKVVAA
jgi:putative transposase